MSSETSGLACEPTQPPGCVYSPSSTGIKRPGCHPYNSPVSSAQVMMLSTNSPFVLRLQLNEQQKVKAVWVSGTDRYGKVWAGYSADWYSVVGEG